MDLPLTLPFTHWPGRRERHLRRRHLSPLFAWPPREVEPEDLLAAQKADHEDLVAFRDGFRALIQRAVDLPPQADSDTLLALKEALETAYEETFALPADLADERAALARLIGLVQATVRRYAGADPIARQELADEEAARAIHFRLLEQPLVADLLHPASAIAPEELTPTLLGAGLDEVAAACELFDERQLAVLVRRGEVLLAGLGEAGVDTGAAAQRLDLLRLRLAQYDIGPGQG